MKKSIHKTKGRQRNSKQRIKKERWRQQGAREQLFCCRAKQSLNYV
jgi:hypothetical protein